VSADFSRKIKIGCAGLVLVTVALGIVIYIFRSIPGGGGILIFGIVAMWAVTIAGKVWSTAPSWMAWVSRKVLGNLKNTVIASMLLIPSGILVLAQQNTEALQAEQKVQELQEQQLRMAKQKEAAKEAAEQRDTNLAAKFKEEKDKLYERLEKAKAEIAAGDLEEAGGILDALQIEVVEYQKSTVGDLPEFAPLPRGVEETWMKARESAVLGKLDIAKSAIDRSDYTEAEETLDRIKAVLLPYRAMQPVPEMIKPLARRYDELSSIIAPVTKVLAAVHDLDAYKGQAALMEKGGNDSSGWDSVIKTYQKGLDQISYLESTDSQTRKFIPHKLNLRQEKRTIERKMKAAQKKLEKVQKAETRAEVYRTLCGDEPARSAWDNEIYDVTSAVEAAAHDPDSIDVENCTPPRLSSKNCWVTTCDIRGKNMFGAMILNRKSFSISKLGVQEL
jgi:hypothetical protein